MLASARTAQKNEREEDSDPQRDCVHDVACEGESVARHEVEDEVRPA